MHDLIIRNGLIVDGSKSKPFLGDVAIKGDRIVAVGVVDGDAKQEIDAKGCLVTPGFVDPHTHYDGQVCWDKYLTPSINHGVTTVIVGNCGVGFAPVRPGTEDDLVALMEGVEDIPGAALTEGIPWTWESFPEYLDALDGMDRALDVVTQIPHAALRAYVMGVKRGPEEDATDDEIKAMAALVEQAIDAGAMGFSTSRTYRHMSKSGDAVPGTTADYRELKAISDAMVEKGRGHIQLISDNLHEDAEVEWLESFSQASGLPVIISPTGEDKDIGGLFRMAIKNYDNGAPIRVQLPPRGQGYLFTLESTIHPLMLSPTWQQQIKGLPLDQQVAKLRDPEIRKQILSEEFHTTWPWLQNTLGNFGYMFPLGEDLNYEPEEADSIKAQAERTGKSAREICYDMMLARDGKGVIYHPSGGYEKYNLDYINRLMNTDAILLGVSDAGAHCGMISDASQGTFMLTHWCRDRAKGTLPIELIIHRMTRDPALTFGLRDRGLLQPGYRADVNIIDHDNLALHYPEMAYDLPEQGRRFVQYAVGYKATIKNGVVILQDDQITGATPGGLVRGPQADPLSTLAAE